MWNISFYDKNFNFYPMNNRQKVVYLLFVFFFQNFIQIEMLSIFVQNYVRICVLKRFETLKTVKFRIALNIIRYPKFFKVMMDLETLNGSWKSWLVLKVLIGFETFNESRTIQSFEYFGRDGIIDIVKEKLEKVNDFTSKLSQIRYSLLRVNIYM